MVEPNLQSEEADFELVPEAEIAEEDPLILDNIVFSTFTKNGKTEYKSSAPNRKLVVLSPTSHLPEQGRSYQVKVIEDTQPDNPKKGKFIVELYYGSVEARAQDLTSQINEKMAKLNAKDVAEQSETEFDEIAKLYKDIEALYESTAPETIEDRGEWLKEFEKKALLEINTIATKYPNNVKLKDIVKNLCGFDSDEAWKWRETSLASESEENVAFVLEGLAGVDSEKAWKIRDYALRVDWRPDRLAVSLAGLDSERSWKMREAILAKDPFLNSIVGEGLAGIDSPKAWDMRTELMQQGANIACIARGLAGVDSQKAWDMRREILEKNYYNVNFVAESLAGINSQKAWEMREKKKKKHSFGMIS